MKLTNQQEVVAKDKLIKGRLVSQTLLEKLKNKSLTESEKAMYTSLLEGYVVDALNALDYDSTLATEKDQRFEEIRSINAENQELKLKLASKNPLSGFAEQFEMIQSMIDAWWKKDGFVWVGEVNMLNNGHLQLKLKFSLSMRVGMFSKDIEGEKKDLARHIKSLEDMGFEFYKESGYANFDKDLLYSSENEELLTKLIQKRFPSFELKDVEKMDFSKEGLIESITGVITDLDDLIENS
ncbi:hypothetical protein [Rossellomorea marisflavi]|uniref:hypothetical protein n=1 Tax=Rossellomorea marisflavi TaxID=189381 RepID=UPI003F9F4F3C